MYYSNDGITKMRYVTSCVDCKKEIEVKFTDCQFYKAKPYCWECRNKNIDKWVKKREDEELEDFDKMVREQLKKGD